MKEFDWSNMYETIISEFRNYYPEIALGIFLTAVATCGEYMPRDTYIGNGTLRLYEVTEGMALMFPLAIVVCRIIRTASFGNKSIRDLISLLPIVAICETAMFAPQFFSFFVNSPQRFFAMLFALFLLLCWKSPSGNKPFATHCHKIMIDLILAYGMGLVGFIAVSCLADSIDYIFEIKSSNNLITLFAFLWLFVASPMVFFHLQKRESVTGTLLKIEEVVINYIIVPATIAYTAILYLYTLKILFTWELPKGGVASMVIGFLIVMIVGRMIQETFERRRYDWFYRWSGMIAVAPLVLFWVGVCYRVGEYGLTEVRSYLIGGGICMTLFAAMTFRHVVRNLYRNLLIIASIVIALLTFVPGITAHDISLHSQLTRLHNLANSLNITDYKSLSDALEADKSATLKGEEQEMMQEFKEAYDYVENYLGLGESETQKRILENLPSD